MVPLFYRPDTSTVNANTIWCFKYKKDISKFSLYDFEACQSLALTQVRRRKLHDLTSIVPLKMKQFLGIELKIPDPAPNIANRYECTGKRKRYSTR